MQIVSKNRSHIMSCRMQPVSRAMRKCVLCLMSCANNKGADQLAHPRHLISAFVVRCLDSIISIDSIVETTNLNNRI